MPSEGERRNPLFSSALAHHAADPFRLLVESVHDYAIFMLDPAGRIMSWNPGAEQIYGYRAEEILEQPLARLYPPEEAATAPESECQFALAAGRHEVEALRRRKDGTTFWAIITLTALCDHQGQHIGFALVTRDITQRRQAEETLRQKTESFRTTLSSIGDAVIATDAQGRVELLNPVAEALTGWTSDQAYGRPLDEVFRIVNEQSRQPVPSPVARVLQEGIVVGLANHTLLLARDGREIPIADAGAPIRNDQGQITGVVLVFRDQTLQRRIERRQEAERELLQQIVLGEPLPAWLDRLCRHFEQLYPPAACSVLYLEGDRLRHAAAPSLPAAYCQAIDGVQIGPRVGSCGTAAYTGEPVLVVDIAHDARWEGYQALARQHGLAACWSVPICGGKQRTMGTFAVYYPQPRAPSAEELDSLQRWAWLAGLAMERAYDHQALRESEERHRHISDLVSDYAYSFRVEPDGTLRGEWISDSFTRVFGLTQPEVAARGGWRSMVHPDDLPIATAHVQRLLSGHPDVCTMRFVAPDGRVRWLRDYAIPVWDGVAGRVVRIFGAAQDITESRQAEEALRRSHQELTGLIRAIDGIVWEADPATFRFTFVSQKAERLLGYPVERWLDEPTFWQDHIHPEDRAGAVDACRRATAAGHDHDLEYRMLAADGRTVWLRDIVTVEVEDGRPVRLRGIMVDITSRKQLEAQLLQSQKMEAIGRLAGGLAHDFNNLLTVINGHAQLLCDAHPQHDPLHDSVAAIAEAGERAAWLTGQLLVFSRQSVVQPQVLDLNEVVRQTERLLRRLIGEDIELVTELEEPLRPVRLDPGQLSQVLINLAVNAREAMPRGGRLSIRTRRVVRESQPSAGHAAAGMLDGVELAIADTGQGMPPEVQSRIFEPFFTTKESSGGTGLGLAVVYGIVQQAGGQIEVESQVGQGTCFRIYLPCVEPPAPSSPPAAPPPPAAQAAGTILVVEDEAGVRGLVRTVLTRQGYHVLVADSPAQALALLTHHTGPLDLLLTDLVMPGMSGRELADQILAQYPGIKVLFMSGYTDDAAIRHGLLQEKVHLLAKPFTPQALLERVQALLTGGKEA
jgi:PAS domain S-box-containing protein